jgi:hypothetical protein
VRTFEGISVLSGVPMEHSRTRYGRLGWALVLVNTCLAAAAAQASNDVRGGERSDWGVLCVSLLVHKLLSIGSGAMLFFLLGDGMVVAGKMIVMMGM